jgi:enamine deaminase RidA (YjgF/YER057c/UK114 family)
MEDFDSDFGMYTQPGDQVAQQIVALAQAAGLDWTQTLSIMRFIADQKQDQYGELMDTAVREVIYDRCRFTTTFYA